MRAGQDRRSYAPQLDAVQWRMLCAIVRDAIAVGRQHVHVGTHRQVVQNARGKRHAAIDKNQSRRRRRHRCVYRSCVQNGRRIGGRRLGQRTGRRVGLERRERGGRRPLDRLVAKHRRRIASRLCFCRGNCLRCGRRRRGRMFSGDIIGNHGFWRSVDQFRRGEVSSLRSRSRRHRRQWSDRRGGQQFRDAVMRGGCRGREVRLRNCCNQCGHARRVEHHPRLKGASRQTNRHSRSPKTSVIFK